MEPDGHSARRRPLLREHSSFAGMKLSIFGCSFKCRNEIGRTLVQQVVQSIDLVVRDEHGRAVLDAVKRMLKGKWRIVR